VRNALRRCCDMPPAPRQPRAKMIFNACAQQRRLLASTIRSTIDHYHPTIDARDDMMRVAACGRHDYARERATRARYARAR